MQVVSIFLASSINEFKFERMDFGNFIRILNDRLEKYDYKLKLNLCEDIDNSLASTRKQDEYNDIIKTCDYFILLAGQKIGGYTLEEYLIAAKAKPKIDIYLKDIDSDDSIKEFKHLLEKDKRAFISFEDFKEVKYKFLMDILTSLGLNEHLVYKDNKYRFDDRVIVGL